ncbi:MAG: alanine racemase [Pseudomonadota bacterium]
MTDRSAPNRMKMLDDRTVRLDGPRLAPETVRGARAVRTVDLAAVAENWRALSARVAPARCAAVIKAGAYGIGRRDAKVLAEGLAAIGCDAFFVAAIDEAIALGPVANHADIFVLDGLIPDRANEYMAGIQPVLSTRAQIEAWAHHCKALGARKPAAVHIDTGMSRLGLTPEEIPSIAERTDLFEAFALSLVVSHPACADDLANPMTAEQLARFNALRAKLPTAPASFANSAAIFHGPEYHLDLVRPGISLYGARAVNDVPNPMQPAVGLHGRILQVRTIPFGASVGYGARFVAQRDTRVATIATGYADGYERALGNAPKADRPRVWIAGQPAPIVGRVSMDLITADVTDIPDGDVSEGDWAELFGVNQSVDDLADICGTIGYELLTGIGTRAARVGWTVEGDQLYSLEG